jgi:hypothetical protein
MGKEDQNRRRAQILKQITKAVSDLREQSRGTYIHWTDLARVLNDGGIKTFYGKKWTGESLNFYCSQYLPDLDLNQPDKQVNSYQNENSESFESKVTTSALSDDEIYEVRKMLHDYRKRHLNIGEFTKRPKFKSPRINSGIRCNEEIRKRSLAKAKEMSNETGGTLNSLIELLLWEFIGRPEDVVKGYEFES